MNHRPGSWLALSTAIVFVVIVFGSAFMTTRHPMFGLPVAKSWADAAGAFTGAAAVFSAMAVFGVLLTLHRQARDSAKQAENFDESLRAQSDAIGQLRVAAEALSKQVADVSRTAEAASKQCDLAEQRLALDRSNRRLDRVYRLMERFILTEQPDKSFTDDLKSLETTLSQKVWRNRLGENWLISLGLVLEAALSLRDQSDKADQTDADIEEIFAELRARITPQQKFGLALAELTPSALIRDDYRPSRLATLLKRAKLFPFIPPGSDLHLAWAKA